MSEHHGRTSSGLSCKWFATRRPSNILEPSAKINDKYYAYLFEMESGRVLTGRIFEETPDVVKIVKNPLTGTEPKVLEKETPH